MLTRSRLTMIGEVFAGMVGGLMLAAPVTAVLMPMLGFGESSLLAALLVYPIGVALGIWLIGRRVALNGRLWHAVIGAYIPLIIIAMVAAPMQFQPIALFVAAIAILPPIFAALAFNRFSRPTDALNPYDDDEVDLLRYHEEGWEDE